ncbi:hypothetical protein LDC_1657, partial [sediment metagenome]
PVNHWRDNDEPDREGIMEIRYIEGIYAYYDSLIARYPNSFRINCASGGRRIDIEMIKRFHVHQKSDFWFNGIVDQASLAAIAGFLPNGLVMVPINKLDNYSFHSHLPSSLNLGWIADDPAFDMGKAMQLTKWYHGVKKYLAGWFMPLTPVNKDESSWIASQYHRDDLQEGMLLILKRPACGLTEFTVKPGWIDPQADYKLLYQAEGREETVKGSLLAEGYTVMLEAQPASTLIIYKKL